VKDVILKPLHIAFISTYPPRRCGIGIFTHDLVTHLSEVNREATDVVAIDDSLQSYPYSSEVRFVIREQRMEDYLEVANFLNLSLIDVISLQHEFGIFGGDEGEYILNLLKNLKKPVVTTLHTILWDPSEKQREILKAIGDISTVVVVMAQSAVGILKEVYDLPEEKIVVIPHGTPDIPFLDSSYYKDQFKTEDRQVILSCGLLSPNKGIEHMINALPAVTREFSNTLYIILGATHPEVKRRYGEEYHISLERLVKEKKLEEHVIFHNQFVTQEQLLQFLIAADIFVTPYLSKDQISSGTLSYALACGKAVISTPYKYAEELLAKDRGMLVPFADSEALSKALIKLLGDPITRDRMRKRAYQFGRQMTWQEVSNRYIETFERALREFSKPSKEMKRIESLAIPEINLEYLKLMTDDVGLLQHSTFTIPDRRYGYCTDDNTRALVAMVMNYHLFHDDTVIPLLKTYLSFVRHAVDNGKVRNFMDYSRAFLEAKGSEDCSSRTIWAVGWIIGYPPSIPGVMELAVRLFREVLPEAPSFTSPRAWAYTILGCIYYLQRFSGDRGVKTILDQLSLRLFNSSEKDKDKWPWCEDILAYDNGRVPQALIAAGEWMGNKAMTQQGLRSLSWLLSLQTEENHLSLIGNQGWFKRGETKAQFDQQPLEIPALLGACNEAFRATGDDKWRKAMDLCFSWYLGNNDIHRALYDFTTGGCYDGLRADGVNDNQGGEALVSWLLSLQLIYQIAHEAHI